MSNLAPGAVLGRYLIGRRIGAGGMGEVFVAEDQKLGRRVAVKVLHGALALDPHGRIRFAREARAAAALNHPNIVTVHSVEEEAGLLYIVMELIDGAPLSSHISLGGLQVSRLFEWAVALAEAVAAAHGQGVVHRDLKPHNVMIAKDGRLKVLDFGLARIDSPGGGATASTVAGHGQVMGTPAYMAPEQAQGLVVDHRADIFSLGVVLFEMATGRRPFLGTSDASVLASLLRDTPPLVTDINPSMPSRLGRVVWRCLQKDPARRYQSALDLRADLEEIRDDSSDRQRPPRPQFSGSTATNPELPGRRRPSELHEEPPTEERGDRSDASLTPSARPARPETRPGARPFVAGLALAMLVLGLGIGFGAAWFAGQRAARLAALPPPGPVITFTSRLTTDESLKDSMVLSADGKFFLYSSAAAGNADIYRQRVGGNNPMNLTAQSPLDDSEPALSPDGERIAFRSERDGGGIFLMGSTGESVLRLTDFGHAPAWSPDGSELLVTSTAPNDAYGWTSSRTEVYRVKVPGGARRLLLTAGVGDGPHDLSEPVWSPHGLRIACWGLLRPGAERDIGTLSPDGTDLVLLTRDTATDYRPTWSPDGRYLYFASDRGGVLNLWRIAIDERTGRATGPPEPVTNDVGARISTPSFSEDGKLMAYLANTRQAEIVRAAFDPGAGRIVGAPARIAPGNEFDIRGDLIAVQTGSPHEDIELMRLDGRERRLLTDDAIKDRRPRFSPDGTLIAFDSPREGGIWQIWTIRPDGSGLRRITDALANVYHPIWAPNGASMAVHQAPEHRALRFDPRRPWKEQQPEVLAAPPTCEASPCELAPWAFSPDGKLLAGLRVEATGRYSVLQVYSVAERRYQTITDKASSFPIWLRDGSRLLYVDLNDAFHVHDLTTGHSHEAGTFVGATYRPIKLAADDHLLFASVEEGGSDVWLARFHVSGPAKAQASVAAPPPR